MTNQVFFRKGVRFLSATSNSFFRLAVLFAGSSQVGKDVGGGGRLAVVMDRFSAADFEFHMWYGSARNPDSTANEPIVRALAEGPANGPVFGTVWRSAFHGPLFETSMRSSCLGRNPGSGASEPTVRALAGRPEKLSRFRDRWAVPFS